jgi:hypothetical protein
MRSITQWLIRGRGAVKLGRYEGLDVLAADAGHRGGHALTGEERG